MKKIEGDVDRWVGSVFTIRNVMRFYAADDITQSVWLLKGSPILCYKVDRTSECKVYFLDLVHNQRLVTKVGYAAPWISVLLETVI